MLLVSEFGRRETLSFESAKDKGASELLQNAADTKRLGFSELLCTSWSFSSYTNLNYFWLVA